MTGSKGDQVSSNEFGAASGQSKDPNPLLRRLATDTGWMGLVVAAPLLAWVAVLPIRLRLLTPAEFGDVSLWTAAIAVAGAFTLWQNFGLMRYLPAGSDHDRAQILRTWLAAAGATASLTGGLFVAWAMFEGGAWWWVAAIAAKLALTNVAVVHARLEDYGRGPARQSFDVGTARALGPLPVVAELGLPLLKVGGQLLIPRGRPGSDELEQARAACTQLGGRIDGVIPNPTSPIDRVGFVVIMAKIAATSPRFPRRSGVPARTPLGPLRKRSRG